MYKDDTPYSTLSSKKSEDLSSASLDSEMKAAVECRERLNALLAKVASSLAKRNSTLSSDEDWTKMQKALTALVHGDEMYKTICRALQQGVSRDLDRNELPNDDLSGPQLNISMKSIFEEQSDLIFDLMEPHDVKSRLGARKCIVGVNLSQEGIISEMTHGKYCDLDDDISYDINAFQKLKQDERSTWEFKWGSIEYDRIAQQIVQAVLALDLQVTVEESYEIASNALSIAVSWYQVQEGRSLSASALKKLFGDGHEYVFKERHKKFPFVQCKICNRSWGDNIYGIGIELCSSSIFDVHWVDQSDEIINETNREEPKCVLTVHCSYVQGFPLYFQGLDTWTSFSDCLSNTILSSSNCTSRSLLVDCDHSFLSTRFYKPEHRVPFQNNIPPDKPFATNKERAHCNSRIRKSVGDTIAEMQSSSLVKAPMANEIYAWGDDGQTSLGLFERPNSDSSTFGLYPRKVEFSPLSSRETVVSVDCSSCHTIVLTNIGSVYTCGDGSHGQLGHGTLDFSPKLRLVTAFLRSDGERTVVTQISAGSDDTSSHSAAIDKDCNLFTWGNTLICGHLLEESGTEGQFQSLTLTPRKVKALEERKITKVSCGGGFTIVLAQKETVVDSTPNLTNEVLSWGLLSNGRLGTGKPEPEIEQTFFGKRKKKNVSKCESIPMVIDQLSNRDIVDISAGSSHALAVSKQGQVYSWGCNSHGECGAVNINLSILQRTELQRYTDRYQGIEEDKPLSLWDDVWLPRPIPHLGPEAGILIKTVSAGGIHSAATDIKGLVYTWGGGGNNACLGHGDMSSYEYGLKKKQDSLRRDVLVMSGRLKVPNWAIPRVLETIHDDKIIHTSLGGKHGAALSNTGNMYLWGYDSMLVQKQLQLYDGTANRLESKEGVLFDTAGAIPIKPNHLFLQPLEGRQIHHVVCSDKMTFCIASNDMMGSTLGTKLYRECQRTVSSSAFEEDEAFTPMVSVDCMLIAGGRRMYCHKVVISQRSSVLNEMLAIEGRPQDYSSSIIELVITSIRYDIMKLILCFIYTDNVPTLNLLPFEILLDIWHASNFLNLQKLSSICRKVLELDHGFHTGKDEDTTGKFITNSKILSTANNPPLPSFGSDLSGALSDNRFADIRILVDESKVLYAHECIMRCASTYFGTLIDNAKQNDPSKRATLKLTGTYNQVLRLLVYIYTGYLPTSHGRSASFDLSQADLMEDLINAHRYQLSDMKSQCDSSIEVTPENACDMLLLSIKVNSTRLKIKSMRILAKYTAYQAETEARTKFISTLANCPIYVKDELFEMIKDAKGIGLVISKDRKDLAASMEERSNLQRTKVEEKMANDLISSTGSGNISIKSVSILVMTMLAYVYLQRVVSMTAFVPVVNVVVLALTIAHLIQRIQ